MTTSLIEEPDDVLDRLPVPHLSHSQINRYLTCPEQYRLYYVEKLRPRIQAAGMVFGALIHAALADFFRNGTDPASAFLREWENLTGVDLRWGKRESWEDLKAKGEKLLRRFLAEEVPRIREVYGVEKKFDLAVTTLILPFIGVVDLFAHVDGHTTIVDFKTSGVGYDGHEAALSDQLTAYALAEPQAEKVALCVFVKTKDPYVQWHFAERSPGDVADYLAKVGLILDDIASGKFYKRPGKHCAYCDFLPVCLGDRQKVQETLVRIT